MNADKAVNPSRALWEKGDFTEIAGQMRQSGDLRRRDEHRDRMQPRGGGRVGRLHGLRATAGPALQREADGARRARGWSGRSMSQYELQPLRHGHALHSARVELEHLKIQFEAGEELVVRNVADDARSPW